MTTATGKVRKLPDVYANLAYAERAAGAILSLGRCPKLCGMALERMSRHNWDGRVRVIE